MTAHPGVDIDSRIHRGDPVYDEVAEFLEDEAAMLDANDLTGWVSRLSQDLVYRAPVRVTRTKGNGDEFHDNMFHYDETGLTIFIKVMRIVGTDSAWAENPLSRTRRFVTNIKVYSTSASDEYHASSSILLLRNRYDEAHMDMLSARREDTIRRTSEGFKLGERLIYLDQTTLGMQNLAIFL
jgi:3-phenylpropionate/cinnamic acid dioxygenase small subunit